MENTKGFILAERLKLGQIDAYEYLMDTYYQKLCAYAYTLTNDHSDAEDLVQNVFAKLWFKRRKINPELSIKSFLYKSIYNEFVDLYRKNKNVTKLELKYLETLEAYVETEPENLEKLISKVYEVIDKLPPKCREIFLMNKKEGLTNIEISEHLNISIKTVEWHISKAFKQLKEILSSNTQTLLFLVFGSTDPTAKG
ncbi:RNA polymerase sigma factor [Maribacter sp. X9]|uniref:RNA polymerase sigma factor n=1 Tax=Maribacter sp. X9 TaxID=3402159 RepID=UPI003AF3F7BA